MNSCLQFLCINITAVPNTEDEKVKEKDIGFYCNSGQPLITRGEKTVAVEICC